MVQTFGHRLAGGKEIVLLFRDNSLLGEVGSGRESRPEATNRKERLTGRDERKLTVAVSPRLHETRGARNKENGRKKRSSNYFSILLIGPPRLVRSRFRDECLPLLGSLLLLPPPLLLSSNPSSPINRSREFPERTGFGVILFFYLIFMKRKKERGDDFQNSWREIRAAETYYRVRRGGDNNWIGRKEGRMTAIEASLRTRRCCCYFRWSSKLATFESSY